VEKREDRTFLRPFHKGCGKERSARTTFQFRGVKLHRASRNKKRLEIGNSHIISRVALTCRPQERKQEGNRGDEESEEKCDVYEETD